MANLGKFLNYLIHNHKVEVINTNDFRDRTIDLKKDKLSAFIVIDFSGTIEWLTIGRVCSRLNVPIPDAKEVED